MVGCKWLEFGGVFGVRPWCWVLDLCGADGGPKRWMMTLAQLDFYFPFVVLAYGLIVTWLTQARWAIRALNKLPAETRDRFLGHRVLALLCLVVGSIWSLQNLWLTH